ncbi:hypothetical protein [Paracoccus sp. (in: a-proteobacteria)]|uniref:hypothetical protein n=1 Tax=Paracoccus sp. TaxID=267 RepID=UPI00322067F4
MTPVAPIIGFRQDRIGARLTCLLNVLRLSRKFGTPGRFLWLADASGAYPELADPCAFFAPDFVARHVTVIGQTPDLRGRANLCTRAPGLSVEGFAEALARGERHECDTMAEPVRFMDESPAEVAAELREIAAGIELAAPLRAALAEARQRLAQAGGGDPVAIHVRRGDILDGDPWSYSAWSAKYVPDEFFRAFIALSDGPVIGFSDTPRAVAHLAQDSARVLAASDLLAGMAPGPAARDLLELLLMAGCASVGAPFQSAFSRAAATIGGCHILALPQGLPPEARTAAHDALLERVIARPDSFLAPGDLAQSLGFAARHAVSVGRGAELVAGFARQERFLTRFPFLHADLAVAALQSRLPDAARHLAEAGLQAPRISHHDKSRCRQVLLACSEGWHSAGRTDLEAGLIAMILTGRRADGPVTPALLWRALSQPGRARRELLFDPALLPVLAQPHPVADQGPVMPLWMLRGDWAELLLDAQLQGALLLAPELRQKLAPAAAGLGALETALTAGKHPAIGAGDAARFGFCAAQLRLHHRLQRAFRLLHELDAQHPHQALTHKRLADACFAAGNRKSGDRWLTSALALAPENAMLRLSAAVRAHEAGRRNAVAAQLDLAETFWPDFPLIARLRQKLGDAGPGPG